MTHSGSIDPFSTFLNVTRGETTTPPVGRSVTRSDVLRALWAGGPVPLRVLSRELGLGTTQVAVLVATLDQEQLVTISASADDDLVALTDAGVAAAAALPNEGA
jgi:DNA-binding MarR family transcriptional regulator